MKENLICLHVFILYYLIACKNLSIELKYFLRKKKF